MVGGRSLRMFLDALPDNADNGLMSGGLDILFAAAAAFVGGHFLLSSAPVRGALVQQAGEKAYQLGYSVVAVATFVWMLLAYGDAAFELLWDVPAFGWLPVLVMPLALLLAVCAFSTPNPTMAGGDALTAGRDPTQGIMRITRHPFLNAAALWAAAHLLANGDVASLILFGGILVLAVGGMWHIDKKKEAQHGAAWGPVLMTTSALPLLAIVQKRTTFDWARIGWGRLALALVLYGVLLWAHPIIFGVAAWPA
jgi:uncharacterized membrane protein